MAWDPIPLAHCGRDRGPDPPAALPASAINWAFRVSRATDRPKDLAAHPMTNAMMVDHVANTVPMRRG